MILFVNGDEHTAASHAVNGFLYGRDDKKFNLVTDSLHPSNINASWGKRLSDALMMKLINKAPCHDDETILDVNENWILKNGYNIDPDELFMIIGWENNNPDIVRQYHYYLQHEGIKHVFFGTHTALENDVKFSECYMDEVYVDYLTENGFEHVLMSDKFFGKEAHTEWASMVMKHIAKHKLL